MVVIKGKTFSADISSERVRLDIGPRHGRRNIITSNIQQVYQLPDGRAKLTIRLQKDVVVPTLGISECETLAKSLKNAMIEAGTVKVRRQREAKKAKLEREGRPPNKSTAYGWQGWHRGGRRG